MKKHYRPFALFSLMMSLSTAAFASRVSLGVEGAWEGIVDNERNACYMVSFPVNVQGNFKLRDPAYLIVTIRPKERVIGEIAYYTGYPYSTEKSVSFQVDDKKHTLYPQGEWAWTDGPESDAKLLKDFIDGHKLVIKGYSRRGTLTTDTYSLTGATATWNKIKKACGI